MAIRIVDAVENYIQSEADKIVQQVVDAMKEEAPRGANVDTSGHMADSISATKTGKYTYIVSTHAANPVNGFEYPARIELGQTVYPTKSKYLWFYGGWHKKSSASSKSGFGKRTVARFK